MRIYKTFIFLLILGIIDAMEEKINAVHYGTKVSPS